MNLLTSKTVFIEYSSSDKGQHFMTVVQNKNHQRIIIGRIYREYDKETKKTKYLATDFAGNQVFVDYKDLSAIKKQFVEHGDNLAMNVPVRPNQSRQTLKLALSQKAERNEDLKNIREKKSEKEKTKEVSKTNTKTNENQKEKERDLKNTEKYKDAEQGKEEANSKENVQAQGTAESNSEEKIQEEPEQDIASERMEELEDIREQNDDLEQDIDLDW